MPQLNPNPWLAIMLLTWTAMMFIFSNKTLNSKHLNNPNPKDMKMTITTQPWNWPWY